MHTGVIDGKKVIMGHGYTGQIINDGETVVTKQLQLCEIMEITRAEGMLYIYE